MAYSPNQKIVVKVEANLGALGWVDITSRGRKASCVIRQGRSPNSIQAETSRLDLTLGNPDGWLTEGNANSPWYPAWGRGCEIRVSRIGLTVSPAERFHGQVDTIEEAFPGGNLDATVDITAVGTIGIISRGSDPLKSAMARGIPLDNPIGYWSLERNEKSDLAGGTAMTVAGQVNFGANSGHPGSAPLPDYTAGGQLIVRLPNGTVSNSFRIEFTARFGTGFDTISDADFTVPLQIKSASGNVNFWEFLVSTGTAAFQWQDTSGAYVDILLTDKQVDDGEFHHFRADVAQSGGNITASLTIDGTTYGPSTLVGKTLNSTDSLLIVNPNADTAGYVGSVGHITWWSPHTPTSVDTVVLATGHNGETAADRMARLCDEEGIGFELTGSAADTTAMGPQLIDTLVANLRDCELADQGLMHDNGTDGAIGYVTRVHLYNQTATIAVTQGSLEPDLRAIRDNQYARNDITSSRPNGGSARVADSDHIALVRARLKDSRTPNVQTDDQLPMDAGWAVHLGTATGARYNAVGINLRNADGALLADQVAAHAIGDRFTVATTALPPQHTASIDGLTVGWTEYLDSDTWRFRANLMPYGPYEVGVYDTARYDSAFTYIAEDLDTTETGVDTVVRDGKLPWSTTASGFHVGVLGEKMLVSSIASNTRDTFTRSSSSGWTTATTGQSWTNSGGSATDHTVSGTEGLHSHAAANVVHESVLARSTDYFDLVVPFRGPATAGPLSSPWRWSVLARYSASNYYRAVFELANSTFLATLTIQKVVAGVASDLASAALGDLSWNNGSYFTIRFQGFGTTLRAKAWRSSLTAEPRRWAATATDATFSSGQIGVQSLVVSGSTNVFPIVMGFDNFDLVNCQTFTVARSRNAVVKTHSSGAQLRLWDPAHYGY